MNTMGTNTPGDRSLNADAKANALPVNAVRVAHPAIGVALVGSKDHAKIHSATYRSRLAILSIISSPTHASSIT